jgi:hypothetical protein
METLSVPQTSPPSEIMNIVHESTAAAATRVDAVNEAWRSALLVNRARAMLGGLGK